MSKELTIWTLDWVPEGKPGPRGHVRDIRLRWACEEAGLSYRVKTVPLSKDPAPDHLARQPFGQVPFLEEGDVKLFESGACLLYLARKSDKLMPRDPLGELETTQWVISALNSIEMVTVPWWYIRLSKPESNPLEGWMLMRLKQLEAVLAEREWLASGRFTVADIMMADALRVPQVLSVGDFPSLQGYVDRACARPAFRKAYDAQMDHFSKSVRRE